MSEVKTPRLPATQKQAAQYLKFIAGAIARKETEIAELRAREAELTALAPTLPEAATQGGPAVIVAEVGDQVDVEFGRAPNRKKVIATVVGIKTDEDGKRVAYKVTYGEGFDADTQVIRPGQIQGKVQG